MVNLTQTELATEEDKANRIDYWARLFKAKTWEDLKMLAQNNEYLEEAANSIYQANAKEIVRQQCRAREDAERREPTGSASTIPARVSRYTFCSSLLHISVVTLELL